jgi:hypothetical protein
MNLFKQTLVASAIVTVCGTVTAADLTMPSQIFSTEGLAAETGPGLTTGTLVSTRIIVREQLEATDKIYLNFSKGITITGVTAGATPTGGNLGINYGSGDFTVTGSVASTNAAGETVVTLEVDTGETIDVNSSLEIILDSANFAKLNVGTASVSYSAVSGIDGSAKDTSGNNSALLIRQQSQYGASVSKVLDGLIEREEQISFIENGDFFKSSESYLDSFEVIITDDQNLELAVAAAVSRITVTGILLMIRHQLH